MVTASNDGWCPCLEYRLLDAIHRGHQPRAAVITASMVRFKVFSVRSEPLGEISIDEADSGANLCKKALDLAKQRYGNTDCQDSEMKILVQVEGEGMHDLSVAPVDLRQVRRSPSFHVLHATMPCKDHTND